MRWYPNSNPSRTIAVISEMCSRSRATGNSAPGPRFHFESLCDPSPENKFTSEAQHFSVSSLHDLGPELSAHPWDPRFHNLHVEHKSYDCEVYKFLGLHTIVHWLFQNCVLGTRVVELLSQPEWIFARETQNALWIPYPMIQYLQNYRYLQRRENKEFRQRWEKVDWKKWLLDYYYFRTGQ